MQVVYIITQSIIQFTIPKLWPVALVVRYHHLSLKMMDLGLLYISFSVNASLGCSVSTRHSLHVTSLFTSVFDFHNICNLASCFTSLLSFFPPPAGQSSLWTCTKNLSPVSLTVLYTSCPWPCKWPHLPLIIRYLNSYFDVNHI